MSGKVAMMSAFMSPTPSETASNLRVALLEPHPLRGETAGGQDRRHPSWPPLYPQVLGQYLAWRVC